MKEAKKPTPEQNIWGLFGKVASFIGGVVVGSLFIGDIGKKH